jgi:uncharacterized membrane protein
MMAVATTQDHWTGLFVCGVVLLLIVAYKRGIVGVCITIGAAMAAYGFKADEVQASNINDRNTVGLLFAGAIAGALIAFVIPTRRKA